jgi:hypothetical protein
MTTTAETKPAPTKDSGRRLRLTALAVIAPIGPLAIAGIRAVLPYSTAEDNAGIAAGIAAHQSAESTVLWLGLIASLTLLVGVFVVRSVAVRGAPVLGTIGAVLAVAGYSSLFIGVLPPDIAGLAAAQAGVDNATTAQILDQMAAHPSAAIALMLFVLGHILGTVLLGVALWKGRLVPAWAALVLIVSQPLHLVFAVVVSNRLLDAAAWSLTAVGFAAAGAALVRASSRVAATA